MKQHPFTTLVLLLAWVTFSSGCASPARSGAMVPGTFDLAARHDASVSVGGEGGQETDPMWTSEISTREFVRAIESSLRNSGKFSTVIEGGPGDYRLQVNLASVDQPLFGFSFTVRISTRWILSDATDKVVFDDFIRSEHTTTTKEALAGVTRLRLATEGAARENIRLGIERLSRLQL